MQLLDVTCISEGMDKLIFGDSEGGITICNQVYGLNRFIAYEHGVNFVYQVGGRGLKSVF